MKQRRHPFRIIIHMMNGCCHRHLPAVGTEVVGNIQCHPFRSAERELFMDKKKVSAMLFHPDGQLNILGKVALHTRDILGSIH